MCQRIIKRVHCVNWGRDDRRNPDAEFVCDVLISETDLGVTEWSRCHDYRTYLGRLEDGENPSPLSIRHGATAPESYMNLSSMILCDDCLKHGRMPVIEPQDEYEDDDSSSSSSGPRETNLGRLVAKAKAKAKAKAEAKSSHRGRRGEGSSSRVPDVEGGKQSESGGGATAGSSAGRVKSAAPIVKGGKQLSSNAASKPIPTERRRRL